ncbi:MAG TPA: hypothetical protein VKP65_18495, partial [Rhodothermales bacterium]|nr:hypothetical protein [Rhodothermales bacterium]
MSFQEPRLSNNESTQRMKKTLIVSISGIRGIFGQGLDAGVLVKYAAAFGTWCRQRANAEGRKPVVVVGRD